MKNFEIKSILLFAAFTTPANSDLGAQTIVALVDSANALSHNNARKIAVDPEGIVSLVFHSGGDIYYIESSDNGLSWSNPENLSLTPGVSRFPALTIDSGGRKHVLWEDNTEIGGPIPVGDKVRIFYKKFFSASEILDRLPFTIGESVGNSLSPSISVDAAGRLHAVWAAFVGLNSGWEINYSEGTLAGFGIHGVYDWTFPEVPGKTLGLGASLFPSVDAFTNVPFVTWLERSPTEQVGNLIKFRINEEWSEPFDLSSEAIGPFSFSVAGGPSVLVESDSLLHTVFQESLEASPGRTFNDVFYLDYHPGDTLSFERGYNVSQSEGASSNPELIMDNTGTLYAVWQQELGEQQDIFLSNYQGGVWSEGQNLSKSPVNSISPHIVSLSNDSLLVVWVEGDESPYSIITHRAPLVTGIRDQTRPGLAPANFLLLAAYPNPFNPGTVLKYELTRSGRVELSLFNLLGERVRTLIDEVQAASNYEIRWDGRDDSGRPLPSGVYLSRLSIDSRSVVRRITLLK